MNKLLLMTCVILFSSAVCAENNVVDTTVNSTKTLNTTDSTTSIGTAQDWGLSTDEWARYQQLMQGQNSLWYPKLSPPEVLGINARTVQEQQHFAEVVAREQHDKLQREVEFDAAFHQAMLKLYANEPIIKSFDMSGFNPSKSTQRLIHPNPTALQTGDHLAVFVDPTKGLDFGTIPALLNAVKKNTGVILDIYCVGNVNNDVIRKWAQQNAIPVDLVSAGHITLNSDNGRLQKAAGNVPLPYTLLVRAGISKSIAAENLL